MSAPDRKLTVEEAEALLTLVSGGWLRFDLAPDLLTAKLEPAPPPPPAPRGGKRVQMQVEHCLEEDARGRRCGVVASFILWGKLYPPEALGPRCYDHAVAHTDHSMPAYPTQHAVYDLRLLLRDRE